MTKLDKLYRKAPQLESPATLDDRVLRSARSRVPQAAVTPAKQSQQQTPWWGVGYVVSYLCVFGIGLGVLMQAGFFPVSVFESERDDISIVSDTAASNDLARSEGDNLEQDIVSTGRSRVVKESIRNESRKSAPLVAANPPISLPTGSSVLDSTSVAINADANGTALGQSIEDADVTTMMTTPEVASRSVAEFSKSLPPSTTAIAADNFAESTAEAVAGIDASSAGAVAADVVVTDVGRANTPANGGLPVQSGLLAQSRQLPDSQSAMATRSKDWLLSQAPDQYTVKIAAGNTADIITLLGNKLSIATELVQVNDDSQEGWLLLRGSFSNKQNAELTLPELFAAVYSVNAVVDAIDSLIKLEVVSYAVLQDRLQ